MIEQPELAEQVRLIKRTLRGVMNGPVSASMREKGLTYKVNFGVELPRLQELAEEMPHTYELAATLWKEDIRECRLLAAMLMPVEAFDEELATLWVEQMRFVEEAECVVMMLFSRAPWASSKAFEWIATDGRFFQLCGYLLFARLFMQGAVPTERDAEEYLDHTEAALTSTDLALRKAAFSALMKYMDLGETEESEGQVLLDRLAAAAF